MEKPADLVDHSYGYYEAMNEVLVLTIDHLEEARHAGNDYRMGIHLSVATATLRHALKLYRDRFDFPEVRPTEKPSEEHI